MHKENNSDLEQAVCKSCGLCCDGTMFDRALLGNGERGSLPQKIEENYFKTEQREYFRLPCPYFSGKCTIYFQKKAHVCSAFRCRLLTDLEKDKLSYPEISTIIQHAKAFRAEIHELAQEVLNSEKNLSIKELQSKLDEMKVEYSGKKVNPLLDILIAKCQILDVLLIRHFKSHNEFREMIISPVPDEVESN